MSMLYHIAYVSFSHKVLSEKELEELLIKIRALNKKQGITGMLLYNNLSFIQVIEGEKEKLIQLYEKISKDKRHENIVKLLEEPIKKRVFPNWSMGFEIINNKQTAKIPGYSNFMNSENPVELIKESTIEIINLLNSFRRYT